MLNSKKKGYSVLDEPLLDVISDPEERLAKSLEASDEPRAGKLAFVHYTSETVDEDIKSSFFATTVNMVNSIIGAGILTLPSAFEEFGYAAGIVLLVVFGLISGLSCFSLFDLHRKTGRLTYPGMAEELFGLRGKQYVDLIQVLYSFGAITGYMVLIGNQLTVSFTRLHDSFPSMPEFLMRRDTVISVVAILVILPVREKSDICVCLYDPFFFLASNML
jgi:amino acid permease